MLGSDALVHDIFTDVPGGIWIPRLGSELISSLSKLPLAILHHGPWNKNKGVRAASSDLKPGEVNETKCLACVQLHHQPHDYL